MEHSPPLVNGKPGDFKPPHPDRLRKILTVVMKDFDRLYANGLTTLTTVVRADSFYSVAVTAGLSGVQDSIDHGPHSVSIRRVIAGKENGKKGGRPPKIGPADTPDLKVFFDSDKVEFLPDGRVKVSGGGGSCILNPEDRRAFAQWRREGRHL